MRREELPAESLKGGCKVIGPTEVKDLVVELGNVVASLREIEDLWAEGGERKGRRKEMAREKGNTENKKDQERRKG